MAYCKYLHRKKGKNQILKRMAILCHAIDEMCNFSSVFVSTTNKTPHSQDNRSLRLAAAVASAVVVAANEAVFLFAEIDKIMTDMRFCFRNAIFVS